MRESEQDEPPHIPKEGGRGRWVLLAAWLAAIATITLTPGEGAAHRPFRWNPDLRPTHLAEDVLNVVLFLPLGLALRAVGVRPGQALMLSVLLAAAIETAQRYLVPGRSPALDDVVMNAAGGVLGALLGARLDRGSGRTPR